MRLLGRLLRLERRLGAADGGCAACRDRRGLVVLAGSQPLQDGTRAPERDRPAPCEQCGRVPERVIEVIEAVVDAREGAACTAAEGWGRPA